MEFPVDGTDVCLYWLDEYGCCIYVPPYTKMNFLADAFLVLVGPTALFALWGCNKLFSYFGVSF